MEKKKGSSQVKKIVIPIVAVVTLLFIGMVVMLVMSDDGGKHDRREKVVTLLPPPPPPKLEEPPPPPEMKEEIIEPEPEPEQDDMDDAPEDESQSVDDLLGLDGDATGADDFGLKAKKGGQSILGGGGNRFAWYTGMFQKEISDMVRKLLEKNGGLPEGELKALVKVTINDDGRIIDFKLLRSSGNERMDKAIDTAMSMADIREMPPLEMPRAMKFRISSKGKG